jgi:hypothetical protein
MPGAVVISPCYRSSKPQFGSPCAKSCLTSPSPLVVVTARSGVSVTYNGTAEHNRFRADNRRFISQSSIGRVSLCVGVPLRGSKIKRTRCRVTI